jgi:large subunit ribosomal protein L4
MVDVNCFQSGSGSVTTVKVDAAPLGEAVRKRLMRQAFLHYSAAHRAGTHSTLTRAEVNFRTAKPWRQKGTGRARSGDYSSPIWRKGGIVFGPKPRSYVNGLNRKARREALRSALLTRVQDGSLRMIDAFNPAKPSTKAAVAALKALGCTGRTLLVVSENRDNVFKSFRNLARVAIETVANLNAEHILLSDHVVFEKQALDSILGGRLGHA